MVSFGHRLLFKYAGGARYTPRPVSPEMLQKNQKGLNGSIKRAALDAGHISCFYVECRRPGPSEHESFGGIAVPPWTPRPKRFIVSLIANDKNARQRSG